MTDELDRAIARVLMPGFDGPQLPAWLEAELRGGLGSVCLFASNVESTQQLRALTASIHRANPSALVAIDEEGGDVTRLHHADGSPYAGAALLGRRDDLELTRMTAAAIGTELAAVEVDLNLAPVADVNSNPLNPVIGVRSFGADTAQVSAHVAAYTSGLQSSGVAACAKHFPGHGDTAADSHKDLPVLDITLDQLHERELPPFRAAVAAGVAAVMTSHIVVPVLDPDRPATLSAPILGLLRDELGFTGVIVTDALDMAGASAGRGIAEAAISALSAGADLLCIGSGNTGDQIAGIRAELRAAVDAGRLDPARLLDAAARTQALGERCRTARQSARPEVVDPPRLDSRGFAVRGPIPAQHAPLLLQLHSAPNIAAGETPWGLAEHLGSIDEVLPGATCASASDLDELAAVLAQYPRSEIIAQGRDLNRIPFLREAVLHLRRTGRPVLVVEEGWPSPGAIEADVATFGAGRATMLALLHLLAKGSR
ncbi:beta-N-acetylhexosaminidase [Propionicimonas paludicola]|uniref:Beta-N-acetylhexosaminidase n=1 Tax=Propionicimonas paludicola TaxID=185243 RepID=A0A2A9CRE5_9ACTN|nr:glycoside hydrolase family 3 N-terminal domain-containing protein [Propionicimonas paludicola]PFG16182.1 beta-N-acetylhexosaminidase [Propionicimonas paludicola]